MDLCEDVAMEPVGPDGQSDPFSRSNKPRSSPWIFVGAEFRYHLFQEFTWTFVKTLAMAVVGHHGQNGPFSRSNEP
ncbi:hypothetical protein H5410_031941 [Solanum commersonii]|uniref:Uncharacterized protein n=1 Tax=Solanum commersonii TaxID=4109 RepID=A0A9J5YIK7_SOLCO|nr:hypothetical protein H5410_031941 [Solanum commersonii]